MDERAAIDGQTLSELEILPQGSDSSGLLRLTGNARTRGGRLALRTRLCAPFSAPARIVEVQDAVRFLFDRHCGGSTLLDAAEVSLVERYLDSRYAVLAPNGPIAARWMAVRYPDLAREARGGADGVRSLAERALRIAETLGRPDPPPRELNRILAPAGATARALHDVVSRFGRSARDALRLDALLRGEHRRLVEGCLDGIHQVDALLAMAETTRTRAWVFPEVVPDAAILHVEGLHHPLIDRPVANDVRLGSDAPLMFLMGPNMGGKTTLMKAAGIAVYLAQVGMGVPACAMRFTPFAGVLSGISPTDSVQQGTSFFLSEVRRLHRAAESLASGGRFLLLFDEMFRGTNYPDALEASRAVILAFARCRNSAMILSSHAIELARGIETVPGVELWHFDVALEQDGPRHRYRLEKGPFSGRLGMSLLDREGLLGLLDALPPATLEA
jgi:DNA mismatch repair ATPase MutS